MNENKTPADDDDVWAYLDDKAEAQRKTPAALPSKDPTKLAEWLTADDPKLEDCPEPEALGRLAVLFRRKNDEDDKDKENTMKTDTIYCAWIEDDRAQQESIEERRFKNELDAIRWLAEWIQADIEDLDDRLDEETYNRLLTLKHELNYEALIEEYPSCFKKAPDGSCGLDLGVRKEALY